MKERGEIVKVTNDRTGMSDVRLRRLRITMTLGASLPFVVLAACQSDFIASLPSLLFFSEQSACPPCDDPTDEQVEDMQNAYDYVAWNKYSCSGDTALFASQGWGQFWTDLSNGKVGINGGLTDWGWWDPTEPEGYKVGITEDFWDSSHSRYQDWQNLAATMIHEGLHSYWQAGPPVEGLIGEVLLRCFDW